MQAVPPSPDSRPVTEGRTAPNVAVLDGVLKRVTFCDPETCYTIARVGPDRGHRAGPVSLGAERVTAVGPLLAAQVREPLRMWCRWASHQKYGRQFEFWSYATVPPATEQGIRRCLGSGLIKGIGPVMAARLVEAPRAVRSVVELARTRGVTVILAAPPGGLPSAWPS